MSIVRSLSAAAAGCALAVAAVLLGSAAFAHDALVDATPGDGEVVSAAISDVSLRFSGVLLGVDTGANVAVLTGPDGAFYDTGCAAVDDTTLTLPVALGAAGTYQVEWRVVSSDGHPISGSYRFTYRPPAGATAAGGATHSACAGVTTARETAPGDADTSTGVLWGVGIGAFAVLLVAGVVLVILRPWRTSMSSSTLTPPEHAAVHDRTPGRTSVATDRAGTGPPGHPGDTP